uniref:DNA-binding protein RFX2-like n=1 Tax=Sinocyclocheilus grahami TaxID=75366 RepID=A0A672LPV8_SINGR
MQRSEGGSETASTVALRTSTSAQAPVVQPVPASQQRVLVQATGSSQKGAQVQQLPVPRVQQVPQQVHTHTHTHTGQSIKPCMLTAHPEDPQHLWLIFCLSTYLFRDCLCLSITFKPFHKMDGMGDSLNSGSQHSSSTPEQSVAAQSQHHQQYIDVSHVLPPFPSPDLGSCPLPEPISMNDVKKLQSNYRIHCEATLDVVMNLQFHLIEKLWQTFWYSTAPSSDGATTIPNSEEDVEDIRGFPREKLIALCKYEPIKQWMRSCDHILYQALVEILIPDVLRPVPSTLTQAIRNFAKSLEGWLTSAMSDFPQEIVRTKVCAAVVSAFAQTLRRYTSLNHLAQAARAVLQNTSQINQMLSDLNRVDFANVQEQASWVCQCDESVVQRLEQDFKVTLQEQSSLDQWAAWLDNVVNQVLKPYEGSTSFPRAARQFLLKWSFYSSMVIRDLTLRSAASFGSFHLIRLLYDEYMFYLVEHRVAMATGETPIAVMGEVRRSDMSRMSERSMSEPAVKSERIEISPSLQEI